MCISVCAAYACSACAGRKVSGLLGWANTIVSCHIGAENGTWVPESWQCSQPVSHLFSPL